MKGANSCRWATDEGANSSDADGWCEVQRAEVPT